MDLLSFELRHISRSLGVLTSASPAMNTDGGSGRHRGNRCRLDVKTRRQLRVTVLFVAGSLGLPDSDWLFSSRCGKEEWKRKKNRKGRLTAPDSEGKGLPQLKERISDSLRLLSWPLRLLLPPLCWSICDQVRITRAASCVRLHVM